MHGLHVCTVKHGLTRGYFGQTRSNPGGITVRSGLTQGVSVKSGHTLGYNGVNVTRLKDTTTLFYFDRSRNHFNKSPVSSLSTCPVVADLLLVSQLLTSVSNKLYTSPSERCFTSISDRVSGPTGRGECDFERIDGKMSYTD